MPDASAARHHAEVVIAVPKGRVLQPLVQLLDAAGLDGGVLRESDRRLLRVDRHNGIGFLLLKPDDVPTYVEYGTADLGVVGRDVLLEREYDLYAPLDLGIGLCRMVVAGHPGTDLEGRSARVLRVATKYPNVTARHFLSRGRPVEVVYVQGSVELAPVTGLADAIVDLVESGETLRRHELVELETMCDVSSVVIANRVGLKLRRSTIAPLLEGLRHAIGQQ